MHAFEALNQIPGLLCAMYENYAMHFTFTCRSVLVTQSHLYHVCSSPGFVCSLRTRLGLRVVQMLRRGRCGRLPASGSGSNGRLCTLWETGTVGGFLPIQDQCECSGQHQQHFRRLATFGAVERTVVTAAELCKYMLMVQFCRGVTWCVCGAGRGILLFICFHRMLKLSGF